MRDIRPLHEAHHKIVVRGGSRLADIWPAEPVEPVEPVVPVRAAAELGDVRAVLELLAAAEGEDTEAYGTRHRHQAAAIRELTAHCRAAVLRAALQVEGPLTPVAVLGEVRAGLRRPIAPHRELLAS